MPQVTAKPEHEFRVAVWLSAGVLATLTLAKLVGSVPVVGTIGFTLAAAVQLYLPLWRANRLGHDYDWVGLHLQTLRKDLIGVAWCAVVFFPPFIVAHHLFFTQAHDWLHALGWNSLAVWVPKRVFAPHGPANVRIFLATLWWFAQASFTQVLGVALPEETFYRGYLQPQLEARLVPRRQFWGVSLGWGVLVASALFALGHFLGEWNPLRLGPFFPGLVFGWLRNRSGSVTGAVLFHAASNLLGASLLWLYQ